MYDKSYLCKVCSRINCLRTHYTQGIATAQPGDDDSSCLQGYYKYNSTPSAGRSSSVSFTSAGPITRDSRSETAAAQQRQLQSQQIKNRLPVRGRCWSPPPPVELKTGQEEHWMESMHVRPTWRIMGWALDDGGKWLCSAKQPVQKNLSRCHMEERESIINNTSLPTILNIN